VELKARFDEARNIEWARALDESGVQVIYGVRGLKTHAKVCIVVRREQDGLRRYVHFGTGNYNESTARLYGDISYMTCDGELGADASKFFNTITGFSQPQRFRKIEMAPTGLRNHLLERIEDEIERRRQGQKASIMAKVNSLADPDLIKALYAASTAGVKIQLNVRGICCLKPGVPGLSENIRVVSIIDRYLEHARIICFHHGGDPRVYISSADWMPRNLDRRVELLTPVEDARARARLIHVLQTHFKDTVKGRELLADGGYRPPKGGRKKIGSQETLYQEAVAARRLAEQGRRTMFQPHRPPSSS
jgi:polyphosphate kinase